MSNYDRAMVAAEEYKKIAAREGNNCAKAREIRDDIEGWVGHWIDGKLRIPDVVREAMGLRPHGGVRTGAGPKASDEPSDASLNIRIPRSELAAVRHAADETTNGDLTAWVREAMRRAL